MAASLRKSIYSTAILLIAIMLGILFLGLCQYQLQKHHEQIITKSEHLLFQFDTIREHIIEALVGGHYAQLANIAHEVDSFHANITQVMANEYIPDEYKLTFMGQVDFPGLILMLRQASEGQQIEQAKLQQLLRESRILAERLTHFDRLLVEHAKGRVIGFQNLTIGKPGYVFKLFQVLTGRTDFVKKGLQLLSFSLSNSEL